MTKKKERKIEKEVFDFNTTLTELETTSHLKEGFKYYINTKNIKINNKATFTKEFNKYLKGV